MLIAVLLTSSHAFAYDLEIDGIYYYVDISNFTCTVTHKDNNYNSYSGDINIPETITYKTKTLTITKIGNYAFRDCHNLTSITIPNSVTHISDYAFCGCTGLTELIIPNSVTAIGDYAFSVCRGLKNITIPNSVTSIDNYAFMSCYALASITLPEDITIIGDATFMGCSELTNITIPKSVTSIGQAAFGSCTALTSITIPESVTNINSLAFAYCSSLTETICEGSTPPEAQSNSFSSIPTTATLYVPVGSKEAYTNATGWNSFSNIVEDNEKIGVESTLADDVNISIENGNIIVTGATQVEVYNTKGQCVYSGVATTIPVSAKGIYLVKVNGKSFKAIL